MHYITREIFLVRPGLNGVHLSPTRRRGKHANLAVVDINTCHYLKYRTRGLGLEGILTALSF